MACFKKYISVLVLGSLILIGCKDATKKEKVAEMPSDQVSSSEPPANAASYIYGNYVSEHYEKKSEGYDWVAVSVSDLGNDKARIKVRSRADKKNPTCTFDTTVYKVDEATYKSTVSGETILYTFENDNLSIAPENPEADGVLTFYCSGGATIADTYKKIDGPIDASQVDKTLFSNVLMLQDIGFNISSVAKDGKNTLTVAPFGLASVNDPVTFDIEGEVVNVEIEDLNSDGSPEVLAYTQTQDGHKYGNVYGFSTNNKKSMSQVYFPSITENDEINKGYEGHDEFAIVETSFAHRFPIFEGAKKTDKTRQITYKLVDGEATRSFVVDQVNEF